MPVCLNVRDAERCGLLSVLSERHRKTGAAGEFYGNRAQRGGRFGRLQIVGLTFFHTSDGYTGGKSGEGGYGHMYRRLLAGLTAVILLLSMFSHPLGRVYAENVEANENPQTGDRMNPTIGGMALAFSGVALCVLADERGRRK